MSRKYNCHGLGPARTLRVSELRRLGVNRRLNTRYLTDAELLDHAPTPDDEDRYLDAVDDLAAQSAIEMATATDETITLEQFRAELVAEGLVD